MPSLPESALNVVVRKSNENETVVNVQGLKLLDRARKLTKAQKKLINMRKHCSKHVTECHYGLSEMQVRKRLRNDAVPKSSFTLGSEIIVPWVDVVLMECAREIDKWTDYDSQKGDVLYVICEIGKIKERPLGFVINKVGGCKRDCTAIKIVFEKMEQDIRMCTYYPV